MYIATSIMYGAQARYLACEPYIHLACEPYIHLACALYKYLACAAYKYLACAAGDQKFPVQIL